MDKQEIEERTRSVLAEQLGREVHEVTLDAKFKRDLDMDSLTRTEALVVLEGEFGVTIPEEEMERVRTVRQAVALVATKLEISG